MVLLGGLVVEPGRTPTGRTPAAGVTGFDWMVRTPTANVSPSAGRDGRPRIGEPNDTADWDSLGRT
jgi:hypothetical protein